MMECGAGFTYDADTNLTGPEAIQFTFQAAASNGLTVVRTFGHGHDAFKSIVLQPRAGALFLYYKSQALRFPVAGREVFGNFSCVTAVQQAPGASDRA
jgi:hypothetical protein